ncbi:MAG: hypothetical protein M3Z25_15725 [Actinomycetota bacterium]|nr:hypothetical protein [Actinomycetota bacterium]
MSTPLTAGFRAADLVPNPDLIAAAVHGCPVVAALHAGRFGEVATYLPGRRVTGVQIKAGGVAVHLVGRYPHSVTVIDQSVRSALSGLTAGLRVTIVIEDVEAGVDIPANPIAPVAGPSIGSSEEMPS